MGGTLGIVGGGQLGRMMAVAAAALGKKVHIYTPEEQAPAAEVAYETTVAPYEDAEALTRFAHSVDAVTFEFENVPHESLELLERLTQVRPSANVLRICRNRFREKTFINEASIETAPFIRVTSAKALEAALRKLGTPAILKTCELGYDGKGQVKIAESIDADAVWAGLNTNDAVLEGFVDFRMELSVIVVRRGRGETQVYDPVENIHRHHILDRTMAPARVSEHVTQAARELALTLAEALNLHGILAVELFLTRDDRLLVNELAPRPHNSGHWTMDACVTDQFEQAVRAALDLPLGSTARLCDAEMKNLIGDEAATAYRFLSDPYAKLHLYGKREMRPGRKMGHVTFLMPKAAP